MERESTTREDPSLFSLLFLTCKRLVFLVRSVRVVFRIVVPLREAVVYQVYTVALLFEANKDIIRLDVSVDKVLVVNVLYPIETLEGYH